MLAGKKYNTVRIKAEKVLINSDAHPGGFGHKKTIALRILTCASSGRPTVFALAVRSSLTPDTHQKLKISSFFNNYMTEKKLNTHAIVATHRKSNGDWHFVVWDNENGRSLIPGKDHSTQLCLVLFAGPLTKSPYGHIGL